MMLMDQQYCSRKDYAVLETQAVETHIITVNSPEQAIEMAKQLAADGFGAIEVCGAFGEELARRMYEATVRPLLGTVKLQYSGGAARPIWSCSPSLHP